MADEQRKVLLTPSFIRLKQNQLGLVDFVATQMHCDQSLGDFGCALLAESTCSLTTPPWLTTTGSKNFPGEKRDRNRREEVDLRSTSRETLQNLDDEKRRLKNNAIHTNGREGV